MHYVSVSSVESEDRMVALFLNLEDGYQEALGKIIKDVKLCDIAVRDLMKTFGCTDVYAGNKLLKCSPYKY